jgi:peptidoglycan/LPS O-acetylase OafA/YrhL
MPEPAPSPDISLASELEELTKPVWGHIVELDSLRGVAAIVVVLDHYQRLWREVPTHGLPSYIQFPILANGNAAVRMFFALSGFVLTLPFLRQRQQRYLLYVVRRVCRIYLPYVAALAIAVLACWRFHGLDLYGKEFQLTWRSPPSFQTVEQHLLLIGKFNAFAYNPPIWSLVHEMRISLIFPLLCLVSLRLRAGLACMIALMFPLLAAVLQRLSGTHNLFANGYDSVDWLKTLGFCGTFLLGSILARHHKALRVTLAHVPSVFRWLLAATAVLLYQYSYSEYIHTSPHLQDFATGIGSCYIIFLAIEDRGALSRFLQLKPLLFLGRISYSLYLVHLPILMVLAIAIYGRISYVDLFVPFVLLALVAAALFNHFVEAPSIRLGKWIGAHWPARDVV